FFTHILACVWIYIAELTYPNWISIYHLSDTDFEIYISSVYFNWVTIFTVGYGDITAKNSVERIYAILIMIIGLLAYTFALSILSNIISTKDTITQAFIDNFNDLQVIKTTHKIPKKLYLKIAEFLN